MSSTAVDRELTHAAADLTPVFEHQQGKDGAAELDAGAPLSFLRNGRHSRSILHQVAVTWQITKVRPLVLGAFP